MADVPRVRVWTSLDGQIHTEIIGGPVLVEIENQNAVECPPCNDETHHEGNPLVTDDTTPDELPADDNGPRCGPGGSWLRYGGLRYVFSLKQARVIWQLWQAWEDGNPEIHQDELLAEAESNSKTMHDLFKRSPAWKAGIIVPGQRGGTYQFCFGDKREEIT